MPDVDIAPPGIEGQDQTHVPTPKGNPCVLCGIIHTFMIDAIQELYHIYLVPIRMIYYNMLIDT
jgi:hypothetical protein